jgi:hypothetical protein
MCGPTRAFLKYLQQRKHAKHDLLTAARKANEPLRDQEPAPHLRKVSYSKAMRRKLQSQKIARCLHPL